MFYRMKVIKELASIFNTLGLGDAHRNDEFLTNFIVDQGTRTFLKEAKSLGFDARTAALYCIRGCLAQLKKEHEKLPESITSQIDPNIVQTLTDALAAVGVSLEEDA
jgi:hypothetical protein